MACSLARNRPQGNRGEHLWTSDVNIVDPNFGNPTQEATLYLADLDGDGSSEIVSGRYVFDHEGKLEWQGNAELAWGQHVSRQYAGVYS